MAWEWVEFIAPLWILSRGWKWKIASMSSELSKIFSTAKEEWFKLWSVFEYRDSVQKHIQFKFTCGLIPLNWSFFSGEGWTDTHSRSRFINKCNCRSDYSAPYLGHWIRRVRSHFCFRLDSSILLRLRVATADRFTRGFDTYTEPTITIPNSKPWPGCPGSDAQSRSQACANEVGWDRISGVKVRPIPCLRLWRRLN